MFADNTEREREINMTPATFARNISNGNWKVIEMLILIDVDNKKMKKGKQKGQGKGSKTLK